ncbi:hypothetical protein SCATT_p13360 (plasmid) [Streptantibioticus cattleyicolor NRRL 8057 = DSM 46488]|uniref:Uncharacterized protein n=1 Tax=Streptantibioticus cattleyicolor (strain ATCC 35852 / DSM 46488 / JCM 4925 / NBRC 14057 / NRRL 8057) TaxID=1003195 RepID=G8XFR8_STREN|nr:hypothetical protein SCATT_p13360 [Streptantibioticus cattleyicolor NRRL 8057 = DSM 46488]
MSGPDRSGEQAMTPVPCARDQAISSADERLAAENGRAGPRRRGRSARRPPAGRACRSHQ